MIIIKFYNSMEGFVKNLIKALGVLFPLHILRALSSSLFLQSTPSLYQTHEIFHFPQELVPSWSPSCSSTQVVIGAWSG